MTSTEVASPSGPSYRNRAHLTVDVATINAESPSTSIDGGKHDPKTPAGIRGHSDLRSPGVAKTPLNLNATGGGGGGAFVDNEDTTAATADTIDIDSTNGNAAAAAANNELPSPLADFITQTDKYGNATTPRTADGIAAARRMHPSGPKPHLHVDDETGALVEDDEHRDMSTSAAGGNLKSSGGDCLLTAADPAQEDACDTLLDSFRMMCCCLLPEDGSHPQGSAAGGGGSAVANNTTSTGGDLRKDHNNSNSCGANTNNSTAPNTPENNGNGVTTSTPSHPIGYSTRGHDAPLLLEEHSALRNGNDPNRFKLLPELHRDDCGKPCLVLDLDETLVHSSFRAVPGADFVIPVQIEDVVHFVYVAKRPGVDEFLVEMAKHYEIVVYTASLNKYADVLLDLLDPHRTIRTRLFRESCVFYEGNYVKDLSLLNRPLSQSIIIDNSPASYLFHPENAIDCTSFIDDVTDRELDQIGKFLVGVKDVKDMRGMINLWRHWPNVDLTKNHRRI